MKTETLTHAAVTAASLVPDQEPRFWPDDFPVGGDGAQGDLLMWRIETSEFDNMEEVFDVVQLAPGTSQGSRHCLENPDMWRVFKPKNFGQFVMAGNRNKPAGYIMGYALLPRGRESIVHPEHARHSIACPIQTAGQVDSRTLEWAKD